MSIPFCPEDLAGIRDDARRIVEYARNHEYHLNGLTRTAEHAVQQATERPGHSPRATSARRTYAVCVSTS
jgi:hypothetical protein